jgi:hypothetical protein
VQVNYNELSEKAMESLVLCKTSYLCETGVSAVVLLRRKYKSQINVEHEML